MLSETPTQQSRRKQISKKLVLLALAAAFSLPTLADEAALKKAVEAKLGAAVTSLTRTPYLGLYQVYANGREVIYTDEKVSVLLVGSLIDGKTMKNVTICTFLYPILSPNSIEKSNTALFPAIDGGL